MSIERQLSGNLLGHRSCLEGSQALHYRQPTRPAARDRPFRKRVTSATAARPLPRSTSDPGSGTWVWSSVVGPKLTSYTEVCAAVKSTRPVPSEAISAGVRVSLHGVIGPCQQAANSMHCATRTPPRYRSSPAVPLLNVVSPQVPEIVIAPSPGRMLKVPTTYVWNGPEVK
jgi:hypothetical protein